MDNKTRRMLTLGDAPDWREETFPLGPPVSGLQTVTLVFWPGGSLDLAWLRFEA